MTDTGEWTTRRYLSLLGNILIWVIVAIDAFYLWPTSLHGSTSMVIVSGHSMEPTYFTGDLVIARKMVPSVGDVIVYAPASLGGSQIVHRIIGGNATDGWKMQGDNNNFVDPFTPKGSEVKGVVLVHYANFGRVTILLLNPMVWAFVLLAAMVLMVWYTGDDCEERHDDDEDKGNGKAEDGPEPEVEEEPDLIDRVVEGTEAAVARMVGAGADAGAAVLAVLTRPSHAPRHAAAPSPRHSAPALLRGSAIVALLSLLVIYGSSTASASQLIVKTGNQASVITLAKCATQATQNLVVTPTGTHTGTTYTEVTVSGIEANCLKMPINVYLHDSAGAVYRTFSGMTPTSGTTKILTLTGSATYDATLVTKVIAKVNGWLFVPTWAYTAGVSCIARDAAGTPTGGPCSVEITGGNGWPGWFGNYFGFNYAVTAPGAVQFTVAFDFSKTPTFPGWTPSRVQFGGTSSALAREPGYNCSQLPTLVLRGQMNQASSGYLEFSDSPFAYFWGGPQRMCPA